LSSQRNCGIVCNVMNIDIRLFLDMNTAKSTSIEENIDNKFIGLSSQTFRLTIFVSSLVVISTIIIVWWAKRRQYRLRRRGGCLLLCGISNSGKTLLFNHLTSDVKKPISDSKTVNHGTMALDYLSTDQPIKKVHVIDIPGDLRQRQRDFNVYKTLVKAIIFIIDSATIEKDIKSVSDYLYDILREKYLRYQRLPLLIFCNKQDLATKDQNLQAIRHLLEDELTMKRRACASSVNLYRRKKATNDDIGRSGKEIFEFNDIKDIQIEFVEGSALGTLKKSIDKQHEDEEVNENAPHLLRIHQWIARTWFK
jgi:signal recognition particle receptor subunit beta